MNAQNKDWHVHGGYSRKHPISQKHHQPLHDNITSTLEPTDFMSYHDIMKARDTFKEHQEMRNLFDELIRKSDALDILYKLDDIINKLMLLETQQNQQPINMEDGKRGPNTVGSP